MGWKGSLFEISVWAGAKVAHTHKQLPEQPQSIFVLRNNDIGDLLAITPLFEALRWRFPAARITAGVGDWNRDVLANNPHVTDVLPVNAPWNNKFIKSQRISDQIGYVRHSAEVKALREQQFEVGIDILGSHVGALLLMQARIPYRLGVRGYRGGHSAMQQNVIFRDDQHVGRAALRFAELLGATDLPECRPQLFLTLAEEAIGEHSWDRRSDSKPRRIVRAEVHVHCARRRELTHDVAGARITRDDELCARRETPILDIARSKDFTLEKLKAALKRSAEIH